MLTDTQVDMTTSHLRILYTVYPLSYPTCFFVRVFAQDIQSEIPSHLIRLKVEVEQNRVAAILADCRGELDREMGALSGTCTSERVLKEHRVGFTESNSYEN